MEPDDLTRFILPEPTPTATEPPPHRRPICANCTRPLSVCLCATLPIHPIPTTTQIIILHHPHQHHHRHNHLSTVPILTKSLLNTTTLISRRLRPGLSSLLDSLHTLPPTKSPRAIYLFPPTHSHSSINISDFNSLYPLSNRDENLVLIVFDGTWKHAKEMVSASLGFLSKFAIRVCLDCDERESGGSIYDSELILRKEPFGGCVSTMEAVARALRVIEPNGVEIERRLVDVLREMVRFQKNYLKPMKPRPKLLKKGKKKDEGEVEKKKNGSSELSDWNENQNICKNASRKSRN